MSEVMIQMRQLSLHSLFFLSGLCAGYTGFQNWRVLYLFVYLSLLYLWGNVTVHLKIENKMMGEPVEPEEDEAAYDEIPKEEAVSSDEEKSHSSPESTDAEDEKKNA